MKIKVFTHGADIDGMGCGFLIQEKHYGTNKDVEVAYCQYSNIDSYVKRFIESRAIYYYEKVFITDLSVSEETCKLIQEKGENKFVLIDHHINEGTEHLNKYQWCIRKGEMDGEVRSATYLVAKYFNMLGEDKYMDSVITHIDNYDVWKWEEKNDTMAKQMSDLFYLIGKERFVEDLWKQYWGDDEYKIDEKFQLLLDIRDEEYQRHLYVANKNLKRIQWKDYTVGVIFNDKFTSELANDLCKENEDMDFVMLINFKTAISLRTIKEDIHLGDIAKEIGSQIGTNGGGHQKASAITISDSIRNTTMLALIKNSVLCDVR